MPVFFAYSGFSTQFTLLWSAELLWLSLVVILIASAGKAVGCWGAARLAGRPNREALAIGALMNARGLMELIILNIGLQRGLITPTLFTVMVTMTLVTTMAAGPLFEWAVARIARRCRDGRRRPGPLTRLSAPHPVHLRAESVLHAQARTPPASTRRR